MLLGVAQMWSQWWQDNSGSLGSRGIYQELICQPFAATIELPCRPAGSGEAEPGLQHYNILRLSREKQELHKATGLVSS